MDLSYSGKVYAGIQQSPFGHQTPPVPMAGSITLARIASPVSVQKKYQPLVLWALRRHLHESKQLLKEGDMLAIPLNSSLGTLLDGVTEKEGKQGPSVAELADQ
jgi:peroxin-6